MDIGYFVLVAASLCFSMISCIPCFLRVFKEKPQVNNQKALVKYQNKSTFSFGKFLSYILVFIITLIALIIFLDTLKYPLSNFFPNLELMLYNLYEVLRDIKSFIIDLT